MAGSGERRSRREPGQGQRSWTRCVAWCRQPSRTLSPPIEGKGQRVRRGSGARRGEAVRRAVRTGRRRSRTRGESSPVQSSPGRRRMDSSPVLLLLFPVIAANLTAPLLLAPLPLLSLCLCPPLGGDRVLDFLKGSPIVPVITKKQNNGKF